jgi:hypothetical protein
MWNDSQFRAACPMAVVNDIGCTGSPTQNETEANQNEYLTSGA